MVDCLQIVLTWHWQLALAAYNWGEGSVQRAIKKQQAAGLPIDFNSMSYLMPNETKNYVPKLQAVKNIISNPELFKIALPKVENQPYFVSVDKTRDIDVRVAAQLAELSITEFTALNPQFNRPVITGNSDTKILLPADNVEIFKNNLSKWAGPLSSWTAYTVTKNERIENIARRLGSEANVLVKVNHIPPNMLVKAGSTLLVPKSTQSNDKDISQNVAENATLSVEKDNTRQISFKAGKKDTLASVARHYKVSVAQIKEWNNLRHDTLTTGQRLQLQVTISPTLARHGTVRQVAAASTKKAIHAAAVRHSSKVAVIQSKTHKRPG